MILTGDRDSFQLISDKTIRFAAINPKGKTDTRFMIAAIIDQYGLSPEQMIDVKGLMGDPSDNIPGVPASEKKQQ